MSKEVSGSRRYHAGGAAEIPFSEFYLSATAHSYTNDELTSMWEDVHKYDVIWLDVASADAKAKTAKPTKV